MSGQKLIVWQNEGIDAVLKHLSYGECRPNQSGLGKSCAMNYSDDGTPHRLVVQTPKMYSPFGAKEWEAQDPTRAPKWDLVLSFKGSSSRLAEFAKLLQAIDDANVSHVHANQEVFFGEKNKSRDIIQDRYSPLYNASNAKYEPKLTTRLDVRQGSFMGQVYDRSETLQSLEYISPHCYVQTLIEFGPLWVVDKRFGQTVRTIQVMVHKQEQINSLAIVPMDMDDENADAQHQEQSHDAGRATAQPLHVSSSYDEYPYQ